MSLLTDFRSRYPIYNDIPDEDLAERLYSRFYSNVPREEFFNKVLPSRPSPEIAEAQRAATAGEEYWTGGRKEAKPLASTMEGMVQEPEISVAEAQRAATAGTEFWARPKAATPMAEYAPVTMPEEQPVEPQVARGRFTIPEPPAPPDTRTILEQVAGQIDPAVTRAFGDTSAAPEQIMPEGLAAYQEEQRRKAQEAVQLRAGVSEVERPERVKKTEILLASILGAAGSSAEWLGRKIDSDSIKSIAETLDRTASALTPEAPTFFDKALMAGGSTLTFVGGGIAASKFAPLFGATVGVARTIGIGTSALLESSAIAQETYEKTMSETGNEDLADTQAIKAAAINLPLSYVTNKLGIFSDKGGRVARTSRALLLEGGQESGQEMLTNILGFKPAGQGVTEAFVLGAVAGGGVKVAVDTLNRFADQASPQERSDIAKQIMADGEEARRRVYAASMSDERIAPLFKEAGITGPNDPKFIELTKVAGELDKNLAQIANDPNVGPELLKSGIVDTGNPAAPEFQGAARTLEQVSQAVQNASTVDAAIAEFNQGVREAGRRAEPVELTEQQLLAQIQGVVAGEPVAPAVTEAKARIEVPPTGRAPVAAPEAPAEAPRIEVPPTGRVEAAPEAAPAEVPRIAVSPAGRIEAPAAEAVAAPIAAPPTGRVEAAAPVVPAAPAIPETAPAAPTFTDLTAPKANKAKGIAKGEVLTFKSEKQAAAYVKSNEVRGFTPRQTEDGWVLSKPFRERTPAQIAAARQRMRVRDDDDLLTALAKMGGLNASNLAADRVDTEDMKSINKGSVLKPFRRTGGMSLDGAAEAMAGMGYDVYDESGRVDATKARELLNEAIMGEKVYSPQGYEILASRNAEEQAQMEAEKEAEAIAITEAMPAMAEDELLAAAAIPREAPIEVPAPTEIPAGAVRLEEPVPGEFVVATPVVQQENLDQAFAQAETQVRQGNVNREASENNDTIYEPREADSPSNAIARASGVQAPTAEYSVRGAGRGVRLLAGGFNRTLAEEGKISLLGQVIKSPADLAELAQIYRNPGYETFRAFFVDADGKIIYQTGVSSRLPGQTGVIPGPRVTNDQIIFEWFENTVEQVGADGFYILHNHPSGDPSPSRQDVEITAALGERTNRLISHVVIDTNRFAEISGNGEVDILPLRKQQRDDPVRKRVIENGIIGTVAGNAGGVAQIGRTMVTSKDMAVVIASGRAINAIGEIPNGVLLHPQRGPAAIRRFARFNGGSDIFIYANEAVFSDPAAKRLWDDGFVTDFVAEGGRSYVASAGKFSPNRGTFGVTRVRPVQILGEERAIQEPSAEAVSVLPRARGGEAVGERDAQREEAAREGRVGEAGAKEVGEQAAEYETGQVPVGRPATPALDDAIRKFQDRNIDIKRIIDSFKEKAGTLLPAFNPYLQEGLSRDRKAAQEKAFEQFELLPMLLEMAKRKVSLAELEEYLHARHAPDYNEEMAKRNPNKEQLDKKMRELNEAINKAPQGSVELQRLQREKEAWSQVKPFSGTEEERNSLSGMSTKEAEAHLNNLPADKKADIEAVATMVDKMVQKTGDLVINSGADPASIRNPNFRFYVPLKREGFEESGGGYGQGFSVTGKFIRTATGSRRKVVDIISNISEQRIRAINRAENNRVANALLGFVLSAPNPELWTVDKVGKVPRLDRTTGAVVMRPDPEELQADNIIVARVPDGNGGVIERKIVFNPGNETSVRIANAFRRNDTDGISEGLAKVAIITRWFANMSTQYNPIFGGVNFIRDLQSSAVRLTATPLAGKQAELIGTAIKVIPSLYKDLRARRKGERRDSQYAEIFKEFEAEGGRTLLRTNWEGSAEKTKELQKIIQRAGEQSAAGRAVQLPGRVKDIVADWLTDYNDTLESAIRLAAYKMSRDQGISKPEAAMIAKDITVNFSRKGTATDNIGALYAFFNASVQGTANMANTLDVKVNKNGVPVMGRRGQKIVAGGVLLGVIQGLLYGLADYEEGEPPDFVKEKNLVIPFDAVGKIGEAAGITQEERSNKYFSIPIALGYNFFPNVGRIATELALGGFKDPGKKAGEAVKSAFDAFSPIGAAMSLQLIAPTAADPIVALMENKDWTGKPIYRESFDRFASEPGFKLARDNASFAGIYISRALNYMSGGTEYSSGVFPTLLSPTPDQIDYLIGQAFGGIGRELTKIQKTAAAQVTGEELPAYSVPVVSRFFGEVRNQASHSQAFYDNVKLLIKHQQELKGREEAGEDPNEYMARHPEAEISDQARKVMREVQQLRKAKREKIAEGIPKEEVREYDEEITQIMAQFNDEVRLLRSLK